MNEQQLYKKYISLIIFLQLINYILNECPLDSPLLKKGTCVSTCTENEFESKICEISNTQIKTQWINNIITIGDKNYKYINLVSFSNEDMIAVSASTGSNKRKFYGIKKNGRYYFKNNENNETPFYEFEVNNSNGKPIIRYEAEVFIAKVNTAVENKGKEYIVSIGRKDSGAELYDFENNIVYKNNASKIFDDYDNIAYRTFAINYIDSSNNYITLFGALYIVKIHLRSYIYKLNFKNKESIEKDTITENSYSYSFQSSKYAYGNINSCVLFSNSEYQVIFFCSYLSYSPSVQFIFFAKNEDFSKTICTNSIKEDDAEDIGFHKLIYLENLKGAFTYYLSKSYIYIYFLEISKSGRDYDINFFRNEIILDKFTYNNNLLLKDFIKINEDKLCIATTNDKKDILIIVTIDLLPGMVNSEYKYSKIRYYTIEMLKLHNYKFLDALYLHLYNNDYIALASNYCPNSVCSSDSNEYYTSLILFSYPNCEDTDILLEDYFIDHDNITMNNLTIFLRDKEKIDNNIFGHEYYGIEILNKIIPNNIALKLSKDSSVEIIINSILHEGEDILITFLNDNKLFSCEIWFKTIYTETNYNKYDQYAKMIVNNGNDDEETFNSHKKLYYGRETFFNLTADKEFTNNCNNENCSLCLLNDKNYCVKCKEKFTYEIQTINNKRIKKCKQIVENKTEKSCTNEEILNNLCIKGNMTNEQISDVYNSIKKNTLKPNSTINNTVIQTNNVIFQVSTVENQKNSDNPNISSIDLGECEKILKKEYGLSDDESLIIIKTDIKSEDFSTTYVQYQIFHPYTLEELDLEKCKDVSVSVSIPVNLNSETSNLYESLSEAGYNLFDTSDSFYTDICTPYTTENGTDISIEDRKKAIYSANGNITFCQTGCEFISYNSTTKKANCKCDAQSDETPSMDNVEFSQNNIASSFLNTWSNSNILVMRCFKLCFSKIGQNKNYGSYLMIIFTITVLVLMIIYCLKGPKIIENELDEILRYKVNMNKNQCNKNNAKNKSSRTMNKIIEDKNNNNNRKNEKINSIKINQKNNNNIISEIKKNTKNNPNIRNKKIRTTRKNNSKINIDIINPKIKNATEKNFNEPPKKRSKTKRSSIPNKNHGQHKKSMSFSERIPIKEISSKIKLKKSVDSKGVKQNNYYIKNEISIFKPNTKKKNNNMNKSNDEQNILKNTKSPYFPKIKDEELNNLTYKIAIEVDKRSYCQYYWALLKKKHIILFAFVASADYNIRVVKLTLFLVSFSLYFTVNGFFFTDSTMHKVYENNGAFNFLAQIVQIIYSSGVSATINMILKQLSISDKDIIKIKQEKKIKIATKKSQDTKKCILLKFAIFFILDIVLMLFFWYFTACFCAVYKNTQFILIENTLMSFALSMSYPFGLNLLPGLFRIPSLKAEKKDKECLYKFSGLISLI